MKQKMKNEVKVFVYGTLKHGNSLHDFYMRRSPYLKPALVRGKLFEFYGLPYLCSGDMKVAGEIFLMPEKDYAAVKQMEEEAGYCAKEVEADAGGEIEKVMAFFSRDDDFFFSRGKLVPCRLEDHAQVWKES